jgi:hypothetical protein
MVEHRFSQETLATSPLGAKVSIRIQKTPAIPLQIRAMKETNIQQHAMDAWSTAWKLKSILGLWLWFRILHDLVISIDDPTQKTIARMFPGLSKFQMILSAWAEQTSHEVEGEDGPGRSELPVGNWINLCIEFSKLIASNTVALCKIGVNSSVFAHSMDEVQQRFVGITHGEFDAPAVRFTFKQHLTETTKLICSLTELIELLETAPATALKIPKEPDDEQYKHSSDFVSVVWDGEPYTFSRGQQAESIRLLWQAWENQTPVLAEKDIAIEIDAENNNFQLAKVFRRKKSGGGYKFHPAWRTMIQSAGKGTFQLVSKNNRPRNAES